MVVYITVVMLTEKLKKSIRGFHARPLRKSYYYHKSRVAHEVCWYKTSLSNYMWKIKINQGTDPKLKWEIVKQMA